MAAEPPDTGAQAEEDPCMKSSSDDIAITMAEWLKHIRAISTRINAVIGFVCPGCITWEQSKKIEAPQPPHEGPYAKCRIVHEYIGGVRIEVSYGGRSHVGITVSMSFDECKMYDTWWDCETKCIPISQVEAKFSTAHEHAGRAKRIVELISPLAPLFSTDKLQWMIGIDALESLERAAKG